MASPKEMTGSLGTEECLARSLVLEEAIGVFVTGSAGVLADREMEVGDGTHNIVACTCTHFTKDRDREVPC